MAERSEAAARRNSACAGNGTVIYEKCGAVARITLNRPARLNAYNVEMRDDLFAALNAVHADAGVRAMVLAGAGESFSTGGDVSEFGQAPSPIAARWIRFRRDVWGRLRALPIPSVAAVHGFTVGGGLEMALLCDLVIAADNTRLCLPETSLGMIPGVAGTQTAPRRLGLGWALDLNMTGRWIDADQALFIGLVAEVVPLKALNRAAHAMALALGRLPREHAAIAKLAIWEGMNSSLADGLELEQRLAMRLDRISATAGSNPDADRPTPRRRRIS
jgi:enoyl-CoA hydratase/carnithine racemase